MNGPPGDLNGADPQCNQPWKDLEAVPPPPAVSCGIGIELVWLMPLLMLARRRRRQGLSRLQAVLDLGRGGRIENQPGDRRALEGMRLAELRE